MTLEEIEAALRARKHPVLLTLRIPAEGGHRAWKLPERRDLYLRLLPHVEGIDVELATAKKLNAVLVEALNAGKMVVLSAHALGKAAAPPQFARWLAEHGQRSARTILKIAGHIGSWRDLQRLAALLVNHPEKQIAAMGLGPHAAQSRTVLAALGSRSGLRLARRTCRAGAALGGGGAEDGGGVAGAVGVHLLSECCQDWRLTEPRSTSGYLRFNEAAETNGPSESR